MRIPRKYRLVVPRRLSSPGEHHNTAKQLRGRLIGIVCNLQPASFHGRRIRGLVGFLCVCSRVALP